MMFSAAVLGCPFPQITDLVCSIFVTDVFSQEHCQNSQNTLENQRCCQVSSPAISAIAMWSKQITELDKKCCDINHAGIFPLAHLSKIIVRYISCVYDNYFSLGGFLCSTCILIRCLLPVLEIKILCSAMTDMLVMIIFGLETSHPDWLACSSFSIQVFIPFISFIAHCLLKHIEARGLCFYRYIWVQSCFLEKDSSLYKINHLFYHFLCWYCIQFLLNFFLSCDAWDSLLSMTNPLIPLGFLFYQFQKSSEIWEQVKPADLNLFFFWVFECLRPHHRNSSIHDAPNFYVCAQFMLYNFEAIIVLNTENWYNMFDQLN